MSCRLYRGAILCECELTLSWLPYSEPGLACICAYAPLTNIRTALFRLFGQHAKKAHLNNEDNEEKTK